jgi:hypothetical protein
MRLKYKLVNLTAVDADYVSALYTHTLTHTQTHTHTHTHTHARTHIYIYIQTYAQVPRNAHAHNSARNTRHTQTQDSFMRRRGLLAFRKDQRQ